ncbi:App1 family protein [Marinomonas fungiae]|uniref:Phosphatidate phosphatase APP1 n=1 Tax=Marinomonas fungiae TaxID=1137284 RepID=A0A0K6IKA4_9GAMM|nr:phosphatase domain-containing protein [Marinomonas fungiae]CUB03533.1 Phosphatidate phosphatase APP1 [Marinomonas fungiae]
MNKTARRWVYRFERRYDKLKHRYKRWRGYSPVIVEPYMTYGTVDELWVAGRLLEAKGVEGAFEDSNWKKLVHMMRRYQSAEIPFTEIQLTLGADKRKIYTDGNGYFHYRWPTPARKDVQQPWTTLTLQPADPELPKAKEYTVAEVCIPCNNAEFGVVSDVDDTIMHTGATNFLRHTQTVLFNNAHTRVLMPGTVEFYSALHKGASGKANNPFFYVSSSPWNIYDLIAEFIRIHNLPKGPVLLKDFGLREHRWFKDGHENYKTGRIESILKTYPKLKLVLVGDSGQKDVYAYLQVAKDYPDRILAVYIRDLKPDSRSHKMNAAASEFSDYNVPFAFIRDATDAVEHAQMLNLVTDQATQKVKNDAAQDRSDSQKNEPPKKTV